MLKKTVSYEDFDGNAASEVLYFNISKTKLMDNIELKEELESLQTRLSDLDGDEDMKTSDVKRILDLVKEIVRLAYGIRSEDGKKFSQTPAIWEDFQDTAVYDAFLYSLFEDPNRANQFMLEVMPKDLRQDVENSPEYRTLKKKAEQALPVLTNPDVKTETPEEEIARLKKELLGKE